MPRLHQRLTSIALICPLLALVLNDCGSAPTQQGAVAPASRATTTPRPTRVRPTAPPHPTRTPATATRAATAPAATATPAADKELRAAVGHTINLASYRMVFTWQVTNTLATNKQEQVLNTDYRGDINRADSALRVTSGDISSETIVKDGVTYLHGPLPLPGADKDEWYSIDKGGRANAIAAFTQPRFLPALTKKVALADFAPAGSVNMDGQQCNRYSGGLRPALSMFDGLGVPTTPEAQAAEATPVVERMQDQGYNFDQSSSAEIVACADGFVHLLRSSVSGTSPDIGNKPFAMSVLYSVSDPNGDIVIRAPDNARKLDLSTMGLTAQVFNGGNVRESPTLTGKVIDQINAQESVMLLGKTADGNWYRIANIHNVIGWVSATLLTVDPAVAAKVPVVK